MGSLSYLRRVAGRYHFRVRVPVDLLSKISHTELHRTLRTADPKTARRRAVQLAAEAGRLFDVIRSDATLTSERIAVLVRGFLRQTLEAAEADRRAGPTLDPDEQRERADLFEILADDAKDALAEGDVPKSTHEAAEALLREQGLAVSRESDGYRALCRALLRASIEFHRIESRRVRGDYTARPKDPLFHAPEVSSGPTIDGPALSVVSDKYVAERGQTWNPKTLLDHNTAVRLLKEVAGDRPVRAYTREDIRALKDALLTRPINGGRTTSGRTLSAKTISKHLLSLSTLFNWAEVNGYVEKNPAKGLRVRDTRRPDEQRHAFSRDQLRTLFERPQEGPPSHRWVPLVGLYTGMRLGEVLQLGPADVREHDGVPCIRIAFADGKQLKTRAAERLIPVHPALVRLGFLRYVASVQGPRLWADYADASGVDRYSKTFGRLLARLGIKDAGLSYHSLRHTFTNALKQADVPESIIGELVGHAGQSITLHRYGKKYEPKVLAKAIRKADFGLGTLGPLA